jgi:hypothetical protein
MPWIFGEKNLSLPRQSASFETRLTALLRMKTFLDGIAKPSSS